MIWSVDWGVVYSCRDLMCVSILLSEACSSVQNKANFELKANLS